MTGVIEAGMIHSNYSQMANGINNEIKLELEYNNCTFELLNLYLRLRNYMWLKTEILKLKWNIYNYLKKNLINTYAISLFQHKIWDIHYSD